MVAIKFLPILSMYLVSIAHALPGQHSPQNANRRALVEKLRMRRAESRLTERRMSDPEIPIGMIGRRRSTLVVDCSNKITYEDGNTYCLYESGDTSDCTGGTLTVGSSTYCSEDACATDCDDNVGCFDDSGCLVATDGNTYCEWETDENSSGRTYEYKYECSGGAVYKYSKYLDTYDHAAGPGWSDWSQGDQITSTSQL